LLLNYFLDFPPRKFYSFYFARGRIAPGFFLTLY
jgi:hypothetical protein